MSVMTDANVPPARVVTEPLFRLIYRSRSRLPAGDALTGEAAEALEAILRVSRTNNVASGLTGALVLYGDWFAQVLEGPEAAVRGTYDRIRVDPRHDSLDLRSAEFAPVRLFGRWAMALVAEHGEPDIPLSATNTGLAESAPWRVTSDQAAILTQLRDMTRGYGRGS